ncbi:mersacidin/lichenicidin family type 2 lantibiotic [Hyphomicrobium sp.]|jgi:mersacidin/lichenicidin family type 2 lantibiotic|uniref:mersacidin/lichenicidin family type 2 lantibiotic n=1 Tax=Hyphomicrobium sp. TaxID=82 RepID=UPI0035624D87
MPNDKNQTLTKLQIIKAWESPEFRKTLTDEQLISLPANPAGGLNFGAAQNSVVKASEYTTDTGCGTYTSDCSTRDRGCTSFDYGCNTYTSYCRPDTNFCHVPTPN